MLGQGFALLDQLVNQGGVVRFDKLVEWYLLGVMTFVAGFANAIPMNRGLALPALCQHGGFTLEIRKIE